MEYLKQLRAAKGVSQQTVADYLEITRQAYSNYENGNRAPDNETLLKMAEYFDVSVDTLLRGDKKTPILTVKDERSISDEDLMAAFFDGAGDLTKEEMAEMWEDARDYMQYKLAQKRRKNNG